MSAEQAENPPQPELIFNITRSQLKRARFTDEEIAKLSEVDLMGIAQTLEFYSTRNDMFWEDLRSITKETLEEKAKVFQKDHQVC